jgi:UDP-N-acetylglucosamine acyltransferase
VIVANGVLLAGHVHVGDRAFISGNVVIHQFARIGRLAMLGGNCAISKDVPPFCTTRPAALNAIAGLNTVGMKRAGLQADDREEIKGLYQALFRSGLNVSQARAEIADRFDSGFAKEFLSFIDASDRGICCTVS